MGRRCSERTRVAPPVADNQVSANTVGAAVAFALSFLTTMFYFGLYEAGKLMESPVATVAQLIPLDTLSFALSVRAHPHPNPHLNPNPNPSRGPNRNPNPAPDAEQDDITNLTDDPDQSVPVFLSPGSSPITK